jgi:murein DD-endopeptidase MepM/ murein hydrolase activator NlpD
MAGGIVSGPDRQGPRAAPALRGEGRARTERRLATGALAAALAVACATGGPQTVHEVKPGENLYRIAVHYDASIAAILRANGLDDPRELQPGQRLRIPDTRVPAATEPLLPPAGIEPREGSPLERPRSQFKGLGELRPNAVSRFQARLEARLAGNVFEWPLSGEVSSGFGRRNGRLHEGIDIRADSGTPIRAAEGGRVRYSGWLGDYGNAVLVDHAGGFTTVYAHVLRSAVAEGERVGKGQVVAEVGATGNATGPHLHFEIRRRKSARNPLLYLPAEP